MATKRVTLNRGQKTKTKSTEEAPKIETRRSTGASKTEVEREDALAAEARQDEVEVAPKTPQKKHEPSGIELTHQFIDALPGRDAMPGRDEVGIVRDHRNFVDEPFDANGKPLLDFRWGVGRAGRPEANKRKGFVPVHVKGRQIVPPGTEGARQVHVAGATLLVRKAEVAELMQSRLRDRIDSVSRKDKDQLREELARTGVEVYEDKRETEVFTPSERKSS